MTDDFQDLDKRFSVHEAVCAQRYKELLERMGRVEKVMMVATGAVLAGILTLVLARVFA